MNYPYITRPSTDNDSVLSNVVENDIEELVIAKGEMIIVGMFYNPNEPKNWTLRINKDESTDITVDSYHAIDSDDHYSDSFARFSVQGSD